MFNFLKIQYQLGRITIEQLAAFTGVFITEEEFAQITGQTPGA